SLLSVLRRPGHRHLHSSPTRRSSDLWMHPTRSIRAQVLSIRERSYVSVARANGEGELGILFREVMPNLVPYIAASFVGAVSGAILAAVGLEAIGLGPNDVHTLGTTIYWAEQFSAVLRGQ